MSLENYLKKGLLKRQNPNREQILGQIRRARKDLKAAKVVLDDDPEWTATIAYHAMLRAGRALLFSKGFLPANGAQHKTVVELMHPLLGQEYGLLIEKFERMRRQRNLFFYDLDTETITEAQIALKAASELIKAIEEKVVGERES